MSWLLRILPYKIHWLYPLGVNVIVDKDIGNHHQHFGNIGEPAGLGPEDQSVLECILMLLLDTGLVLAYVKRRHQDEGTVLALEGNAGTATIVPAPAG